MTRQHIVLFLCITVILLVAYQQLYGSKLGPKGITIGIDLGTSYSCVGVFNNSKVDIIANDQEKHCTPSYVAFTADGHLLIGDAARSQVTSNPENTIFDVKRFIGRTWSDPLVQKDVKLYPFKMFGIGNRIHFQVQSPEGTKTFAAEEISALVLQKMKDIAEDYLGTKVYNAVVSVPAYFNDAQRSATIDAATIAGFRFVRLMNEPSLAAIAHGGIIKDGKQNILVFHLGGGTFDVSVILFDGNTFEVLGSHGNTRLGGADFDQNVIDYFIEMIKRKKRKDISKDNRTVQKLRLEVEKAKRTLSSAEEVTLEIPSFSFFENLTRAKFEELNMHLFRSTMASLKLVLAKAHLSTADIDEVILVGGSTRIPKIRGLITEFFNGKEPSQSIDPYEAVVFGAARALSDDTKILLDVNHMTFGFEISGGLTTSLIPKYNFLPFEKKQKFRVKRDVRKFEFLKVYEGDHRLAKDNHLLGTYLLPSTEFKRGGVLEITFTVDLSGILNVTAQANLTGETITLNNHDRLMPEEVIPMVRRAEILWKKYKSKERKDKREAKERESS